MKHVTATDMSESMLRLAAAKLGGHGNIRFLKEDANDTSFEPAAFDAVLLVNLLHVVDDPAGVLEECHRVLREGGRVVVADITSQGTSVLAGMRLGLRYLRRWGRGPTSGRNLTLNALVRLVEAAGFEVDERALVGAGVKAACLTGRKEGTSPVEG